MNVKWVIYLKIDACLLYRIGDIGLHCALMQDHKRNVFMEADIRCSNAIQSMERRLRAACHSSDAKIDNVVKVNAHYYHSHARTNSCNTFLILA